MKIVIVSTNFSPAFIGHMKAWYQAYTELGVNVLLYFDKEYEKYFDKNNYKFTTDEDEVIGYSPCYAILQNPGMKNGNFIRFCKKNKIKLIYLLHEPYAGLKWVLSKKGNVLKIALVSMLNYQICNNSTKIILCSKNAIQNFDTHMKKFRKRRVFLPLLYLDQYVSNGDRKYFSYIGGIGYDHAFDEFIKFVKQSAKNNEIDFQIVTRNNIEEYLNDDILKDMISKKRLKVQQGRPLTEEEMNLAFRNSIAVWNGYRSSTQSGVIANAFMQGTPSIATKLKSFESLVVNGSTGAFIDRYDYDSIFKAYKIVKKDNVKISKNCRNYFIENFYYRAQLNNLKNLILK